MPAFLGDFLGRKKRPLSFHAESLRLKASLKVNLAIRKPRLASTKIYNIFGDLVKVTGQRRLRTLIIFANDPWLLSQGLPLDKCINRLREMRAVTIWRDFRGSTLPNASWLRRDSPNPPSQPFLSSRPPAVTSPTSGLFPDYPAEPESRSFIARNPRTACSHHFLYLNAHNPPTADNLRVRSSTHEHCCFSVFCFHFSN
jgi:hypothetical protein